jgi:hypothetical protein
MVTLSQMHDNYMNMFNLMRKAEELYPEGEARSRAYAKVAEAFDLPSDSFSHIS